MTNPHGSQWNTRLLHCNLSHLDTCAVCARTGPLLPAALNSFPNRCKLPQFSSSDYIMTKLHHHHHHQRHHKTNKHEAQSGADGRICLTRAAQMLRWSRTDVNVLNFFYYKWTVAPIRTSGAQEWNLIFASWGRSQSVCGDERLDGKHTYTTYRDEEYPFCFGAPSFWSLNFIAGRGALHPHTGMNLI